MLEELRIRNLGVIEDAVLPLGPGLTVVTGETGAGKTMVVSGLLLLFGGRGDPARVRTGADQAVIDGRLELVAGSPAAERVVAAGGELDDGTGLALRRTVGAAGRSRAYVGGAPTPVAVLGELAERLLAVHGQSDQLRLVRSGEQRSALDRFGGIDASRFAAAFHEWRAAADALADRTSRLAELRREADLLTYGLNEIETADPQPGEDSELAATAARLAHADGLRLAAGAAHDALLGDADDPSADATDVVALLGSARRLLGHQAGADPALDSLASRVVELADLAADLGSEFSAYAAGLDADPARLDQIEERRAVLNGLVRKYADGPEPDLASVLEWARGAAARLSDIDVSDEALAALAGRRDEHAARAASGAAELSARRRAAATELAAAVTAELAGLAMPLATFTVDVRPRPVTAAAPMLVVDGVETGLTADGGDEVELLLQAHPEAPALPLGRGASGGELSRVMLALEVCLAGTDPMPTMVFDEVDAGVGGRAAVEVGRRLARLARGHQVLVVTHLAQVAAYADRHIVVDKQADGSATTGVTASDVHLVTGDDRIAELARMLGGSASETAREHAAELLRTAAVEPAPTVAARPVAKSARARRKTAKTPS